MGYAILLLGLVALLSWWYFGALFFVPIALAVGRWGVPVGAVISITTAMFVLTGLVGGSRVSTPESAVRQLVPDDPRMAPLDFAWPSYFFQQCWFDIAGYLRHIVREITVTWRWAERFLPGVPLQSAVLDADDRPRTIRSRTITIGLTWPVLTVPAAFLAGATAGATAAAVLVATIASVMSLVGITVTVAVLSLMTLWARAARRIRRSTACCTRCFHLAKLPAYPCPGSHPGAPETGVLHRRLRPGIHGLWWHRCGCGKMLPTTPARIARALHPVCPLCLSPLHSGSGYATEVRVALFGAPRSGKSELVRMAVEQLTQVPGAPAEVADLPLEPSAQPSAVTLEFGGRRPTLVHVFHSRGRDLLDPERRRQLSYLDHVSSLIYALDPISVPALRTTARELPGLPYSVEEFAADDPEESYHAVVSGMRFINVDTRNKLLAVVVTKSDVLAPLDGASLGPSSEAVQQWLRAHGIDGISFSVRNDFRMSRYFRTTTSDCADAVEPLRWLLRAERVHRVKT